MASSAAVANAGRFSPCFQLQKASENGVEQLSGPRPALLHQKLGAGFLVRRQHCPLQKFDVRAQQIARNGWGGEELASINVGRRQVFRSGRMEAVARGADSEGEKSVDEMKQHSEKAANPYGYAWWKVMLAIVATAAFAYHFTNLETQMHAVQAADLPKITVPDKWPWPRLRTPAELETTFRILGEAGRGIYKRYLIADFFFPAVYTVLYSQLLGFLVVWSQFWAKLPRRLFPTWAGALAYTVFPFDLLENAAIMYVLLHPGGTAVHFAGATSGYFTWVKFAMVVVSVSFMYMGLLLGIFDFVFKLLRNRYDGFSAIIRSLRQR